MERQGNAVTALNRQLEEFTKQRIVLEEQVRQIALREQTMLLQLIRDGTPVTAEVIQGHVIVLGLDNMGAQVLLRLLTEKMFEPHAVEGIVHEIISVSAALAVDMHGCALVQRVIDYGTEHHLTLLVHTLSPVMFQVCTAPIGASTTQYLIDRLVRLPPSLRVLFISSIRVQIVDIMKDINGVRVVQRCLDRWPNLENQFIYVALLGRCREVACNRHGCCAVQKCIERGTEQQRLVLATEILADLHAFIQDSFGNYIVQYLVDLNLPMFNTQCSRLLLGQVALLSCNKFSSNVVERCLRVAPPDTFQLMLDEILEPSKVREVLQDGFGNYVVQTALSLATPDQLEAARHVLSPLLRLVRRTPCGRKLEEKLNGRKPRRKKKNKSKANHDVDLTNPMSSADSSTPVTASFTSSTSASSPGKKASKRRNDHESAAAAAFAAAMNHHAGVSQSVTSTLTSDHNTVGSSYNNDATDISFPACYEKDDVLSDSSTATE